MWGWDNLTYEQEKALGRWNWKNVTLSILHVIWDVLKFAFLAVYLLFKFLLVLVGMN